MSQKLKKIIIVGIVAITLVYVGGIYTNKWVAIKMQKVNLGLAESNFPYRDYTEAELAKMYPQIRYADVATRVTPEETYANFRQALKDNNLEMALEQLSGESEKYNENVNDLNNVYKENRFEEIYRSYPEEIWRGTFGDSIGQLCYDQQYGNQEFVGCSGFIKDASGSWKLDSL